MQFALLHNHILKKFFDSKYKIKADMIQCNKCLHFSLNLQKTLRKVPSSFQVTSAHPASIAPTRGLTT